MVVVLVVVVVMLGMFVMVLAGLVVLAVIVVIMTGAMRDIVIDGQGRRILGRVFRCVLAVPTGRTGTLGLAWSG